MNKERRTLLKGSRSVKPRRNTIQAQARGGREEWKGIMWWQTYHRSPAQARHRMRLSWKKKTLAEAGCTMIGSFNRSSICRGLILLKGNLLTGSYFTLMKNYSLSLFDLLLSGADLIAGKFLVRERERKREKSGPENNNNIQSVD